jgi:mRNA interferase MazF
MNEFDFNQWIEKKIVLHNKSHRAPFVSEGDIWWASIGQNVGSEVNGKSELYSRPVIILKKLSHNFYLVIPTSTKSKEGTWYISYRHKEVDNVACLHQIRTIDYRRILGKVGTLDDADFGRIKSGFSSLYR